MKPKESSKYKICPLNMCSGKICIGSKCMWWCEFAQGCAVPLLAAMFADSEEEVIEPIKEQPKTGGWILFTLGEDGSLNCGLPDEGEEILVSDGDDVWVDTFGRKGHSPCIKSSIWLAGLAWMPLPEPYGVEG